MDCTVWVACYTPSSFFKVSTGHGDNLNSDLQAYDECSSSSSRAKLSSLPGSGGLGIIGRRPSKRKATDPCSGLPVYAGMDAPLAGLPAFW